MLLTVKSPYIWAVVFFFSAGIHILPATAQENSDTESGAKQQVRRSRKFEYKLDNRPDPFYPFISKDSAKKEPVDEILDVDGKKLTGMRLFEPGQLKLVAVMGTPNGKIAMAEDVTGKGYILQENMLIGKRGQIVKIEDGQVVIKETTEMKSGRVIHKEITMRLKQDEEKRRR